MPPVVRWCFALALCALAWLVLGLPALGMALGVRAPPALPAPSQLDAVTLPDGSQSVGACRRQRVGQLIYVHLEGDPVASGYAQGLLVGDRVARIETDMMGMFVERVPSFWARHLILGMVNFNNRTLADYFLPSELDEIAAITSGHHRAHDCYLGVSPSYARGMQYHALHDISQYLIDNPLVHPPQVGCTAVALAGARTVDGHLLIGRLFDFEGGTCFDSDKVVYTVAPDHGHRYVAVSWGGMAGAVTGLNDAKLWVSINAAATDGHPPGHGLVDRYVGRPIVMVVRRMLQDCATIDEAAIDFWIGPHNTETFDWIRKATIIEIVESPDPTRSFPYTPLDHGSIVPISTVTVSLLSIETKHLERPMEAPDQYTPSVH